MHDQAMINEEVAHRYVEQEEWEARVADLDANNDVPTQQQTSIQNNPSQPTQASSIHGNVQIPSSDDAAADKGKETTYANHTQDAIETPKKRRNMHKWMDAAFVNGVRIYVKNRGRSERIAKQSKPFQFDDVGSGSTADKAFDVSP